MSCPVSTAVSPLWRGQNYFCIHDRTANTLFGCILMFITYTVLDGGWSVSCNIETIRQNEPKTKTCHMDYILKAYLFSVPLSVKAYCFT